MNKAIKVLFFGLVGTFFFVQTMEKRGLPEGEEIELTEPAKRAKVQDPASESTIEGPILPDELWVKIIEYVNTGATLQDAIKNIRALAHVNKLFNALIGDYLVTQNIIKQLYDAYSDDPQADTFSIARLLNTAGAREWLADAEKVDQAIKNHDYEFLKAMFIKGFNFDLIDMESYLKRAVHSLDLPLTQFLIEQVGGYSQQELRNLINDELGVKGDEEQQKRQAEILSVLLEAYGKIPRKLMSRAIAAYNFDVITVLLAAGGFNRNWTLQFNDPLTQESRVDTILNYALIMADFAPEESNDYERAQKVLQILHEYSAQEAGPQ